MITKAGGEQTNKYTVPDGDHGASRRNKVLGEMAPSEEGGRGSKEVWWAGDREAEAGREGLAT